jgi:hypothetical protein
MHYLKQHKELIPFIIAMFIFVTAAFNLFREQRKNSRLLTKGATVLPTFATGRAACELPAPDLYRREWIKDEKLQSLKFTGTICLLLKTN